MRDLMLLTWLFSIPVYLFGWFMEYPIVDTIAFWVGVVSFSLWLALTIIIHSITDGNFLCYNCNKSFWKESSLEKHYINNECPRSVNTSSKGEGRQ